MFYNVVLVSAVFFFFVWVCLLLGTSGDGWISQDAVSVTWDLNGMCEWHWDWKSWLVLTEKVLEGRQ